MPDPFITPEDLSEYLGRDVDTDPAGTLAIDFACDACRVYAGQSFNAGTSTIALDGTGTDALFLPQVPASSVSVAVRDSEGTYQAAGSADFSLSSDGVLYATNSAGTSGFGSCWPRGRQNIQVTYEHGYSNGEMPPAIKGVALQVASRMIVQGPALFESMGDLNIRYAAEATALMPTERLLLDKHRRHHNGS